VCTSDLGAGCPAVAVIFFRCAVKAIFQFRVLVQQGRSQELKFGGAVLAMGQGRGQRPRARRAAPRGRGLGRVALSSFGGSGVLPPENFSNLSSKSVHFNAYLRSYVVSRSVFFSFFFTQNIC
jgi:hypothetical protein